MVTLRRAGLGPAGEGGWSAGESLGASAFLWTLPGPGAGVPFSPRPLPVDTDTCGV